MSDSRLMLVNLSAISSTAAGAINITDAEVAAGLVAGPLKFASAEGRASTVIGGVCTDYSGNIYLTDTTNHCIIKVTESGVASVLAGLPGTSGRNSALQNVTASAARFNAPRGIACDKSNNIYVADTANNQIRIIKQNGLVGMFAGNGSGTAGLVDAAQDPTQAQFSAPYGVAVDNSGVVWVADYGNHALRKIVGGKVLTVAGNGSAAAVTVENVAANNHTAQFSSPNAVAVDSKQNVYVSDSAFYKIKKYTPNGWLYLHSGSGVRGKSLGTGTQKAFTCTYEGPTALAANRYGYLFLLDLSGRGSGSRIVLIDPNGVPANVAEFASASSYDTGLKGIGVSPANKAFVSIVI